MASDSSERTTTQIVIFDTATLIRSTLLRTLGATAWIDKQQH